LVEGNATAIVQSVVLAVRSFVRGHDIRLEDACLVKTAQRSIHRGIANAIQPAVAQPAENVIAIAVVLGEDGKDGEVQDALQKLAGIDRLAIQMLHAAVGTVLRIAD